MFKQSLHHYSKHLWIIFVLILLTGCWDQQEISKQAYVVAIGMDKYEKNPNKIKVSYLIANPDVGQASTGGGGQSEPPAVVMSFPANDITTAKDIANMEVAKPISYDMLKIIIVSEEFARDENFVKWLYDTTKEPEIKMDIRMLVVPEGAAAFLNRNKPILETRPHEYYELILRHGDVTGLVPPTDDLLTFFRIAEAGEDMFLAIYGTTTESDEKHTDFNVKAGELPIQAKVKDRPSYAGAAAFFQGKMVDIYTAEEARLVILMNNTYADTTMLDTVNDPFNKDNKLAVQIHRNGITNTKMDFHKGKPRIKVKVPINVQIVNHSMHNISYSASKRHTLKRSIEQEFQERFQKFIDKTKEETKAQPFGWSLAARKAFATIPAYEAFRFNKQYPDMEVSVTVEVILGQDGRQNKTPTMQDLRDKK
ncbi:Ger(x)C family spore germination protein [Ornithinibacillus gellani]|uniref:Ger(x)C family spore germination protein n=1 Tax=Ornithinibacillus gellani TaxID=2293253 RepID=UPI000F470B99|nr:Ger(x)C family spore germination protein [Ornithinibacillus gellani]TQS75745.1 Ger(x)C family spore germination protein [Ornithinibacillus gellani]